MATKAKAKKPAARKEVIIACTPIMLPREEWVAAAATAIEENPANAANEESLITAVSALTGVDPAATTGSPDFLAVLVGKHWGKNGAKLGVQFTDNPNQATRNKIIAYANQWGERTNIKFSESAQGQIRVARENSGYWSYLGTDCLRIAAGRQTMNLQGFTERTSDAEYSRVVVHEFGHALGFPHEHLRRSIIELLDFNKTVAYFRRTQGWSQATTVSQVLTPLEESSLFGSSGADLESIMTYQLPGECTKSGRPIPGGRELSDTDREWAGKIYPAPIPPPPPPPPGGATVGIDIEARVVTAPAGWTIKHSA